MISFSQPIHRGGEVSQPCDPGQTQCLIFPVMARVLRSGEPEWGDLAPAVMAQTTSLKPLVATIGLRWNQGFNASDDTL